MGRELRQDLAAFIAETERVRDLLSAFMPKVEVVARQLSADAEV
jgi:hypothetical protein